MWHVKTDEEVLQSVPIAELASVLQQRMCLGLELNTINNSVLRSLMELIEMEHANRLFAEYNIHVDND